MQKEPHSVTLGSFFTQMLNNLNDNYTIKRVTKDGKWQHNWPQYRLNKPGFCFVFRTRKHWKLGNPESKRKRRKKKVLSHNHSITIINSVLKENKNNYNYSLTCLKHFSIFPTINTHHISKYLKINYWLEKWFQYYKTQQILRTWAIGTRSWPWPVSTVIRRRRPSSVRNERWINIPHNHFTHSDEGKKQTKTLAIVVVQI